MAVLNPADFLVRCSESSQTAYESLKGLLDGATNPAEAGDIRRFLTRLIKECESIDPDEFLSKYHFTFNTLTLDGHAQTENHLVLLQLPSIFTPEEWSFTFYEGLARYPSSEFQGRTVAELGCGNGWISIALASKNLPQKIYGLDINPRAIACARLNLILNAFDNSGSPIIDSEGKTLLDRVEFHTSDLLGHIIEKKIQLDRVIGCIPQVLSPEPLLVDHFVREDADDQFLYSLSNYCEKQGYIEDQFGLGLIARALEEAIVVCKPSGKIVMNMGGRPGAAVLDRMFKRRGFTIRKLWTTKVWQASDTDIQPLVDIEKATPHRFEFFTSLSSDEPISAQTAQAYAAHGGRIAHSLCVYEAQLKQAAPIKSIFKLISQPGYEDSRSGVDLSFSNDELADEKINFIGSLAEWLQQKPNLPYSDTEGEPQLRRQIAQFFRSYWRVPLTAKSIFIAPNRRSIIKNIIHLFRPRLTLIDRELSSEITRRSESKSTDTGVILEAPRRVDEICKLIDNLTPDLVITSLQDFETKTSDAFVRLSDVCKRHGTRLLIDLSQQFELSSQPAPNGILSQLVDSPLPPHVGLLFGLVKNKVYSDLELSFLLSENDTLLDQLAASAELTYSRPPLLTQKYYSRIFSDLLNFQLTDLRRSRNEDLRVPKAEAKESRSELSDGIKKAFAHPSLQSHALTLTQNTTRLDYGENCLKSPTQVHASIIESFLRQNVSASDLNVEQQIIDFVANRFSIGHLQESSVLLGNGVAPLFAAALECFSELNQKIIIPQGSYGYFTAACDFFNTQNVVVKTLARDRFKITAQELDATLSVSGAHWLYLNAPVVNPTGTVYTPGELSDLLDVLAQHRCGLILDTIFSGLEFNRRQTHSRLNRLWPGDDTHRVPLIMLGGLSKELAAGGLRFGWAICSDQQLSQNMKGRMSSLPHSTVRHAARKIYQSLKDNSHHIHEHLEQQRKTLKERAKCLSELLTTLGWDVIESEGGLFVCASPRKYLEDVRQSFPTTKTFDETKAADKICEQIFTSTGLLLNSATWTGLPSHLRFVISLDEKDFDSALLKLREFDAGWKQLRDSRINE